MQVLRTALAAVGCAIICAAWALIALAAVSGVAAADEEPANDPAAATAMDLPDALFGNDEAARTAAIEQLKKRPHEAVDALLAALDGDDFERRVTAGEALLEVVPRDAQAAKAIFQALEFTNSNVELETFCRRALVRIGRAALPTAIEHYNNALWFALSEPGDDRSLAAIVERLKQFEDSEEEAIAGGFTPSLPTYTSELLALGPRASAAAVGKALEERPTSNHLFAAAHMLSSRGADGLTAGLIKQFDSASRERRIQAADALGRIGKPAVPALVKAAANPKHRPLALSALAQIGPDAADAVDVLRPLIACDDVVGRSEVEVHPYERDDLPPLRMSNLALEALAAIGPAAASAADDILKRELAAGPKDMRIAARWASTFKSRGNAFVPLLAHDLSPEATSQRVNALCDALAKQENRRNEPPTEIRKQAKEDDWEYRQELAVAWSRVMPDDERLAERFYALLNEGNPGVFETGCWFRADLKNIAPVALASPKKYKSELEQMLNEKGEPRIKALYTLTLMEPDSPAAIARAAAAMQDACPDMRHAAFTALAEGPGYSPDVIVAIAKAAMATDEGDFWSRLRNSQAWEAIDRRGAAIKAALPQLRELATTPDEDGKLSVDQHSLLRLVNRWDRIDEPLAHKLATRLKDADPDERIATALALSSSAMLPEQTLPVLAAALEEGNKHRETATLEYMKSVAEYATAIGRYGAAARGQKALLLKLALRDRMRTDLGNSSRYVDGERLPVEGKVLDDGPVAIESLVALGRIGAASSQSTLDTLRDAFVHSPLQLYEYGFGNNARLAAAVAILRIDGRGLTEDVATVVESLRLVGPQDITPSLAEELTVVGNAHPELVPRLRQLLAIAHWRFGASRPDPWRFSGVDEYEEAGDRLVTLAKCVAAISPEDESLRAMLREALAWELSYFAYQAEPRTSLIEILARLGDRSEAFRSLATKAADDRFRPAVRYAADEALRAMGK